MPSKTASVKNGKYGGRPKTSPNEKIEIEGIRNVILTQNQYNKLQNKYGNKLLRNALIILDKWLDDKNSKMKKYIGKNHYAHFRSDGYLINSVMYNN